MYPLDINAAKSADNTNLFIDRTGKYIGKFTRAQQITAQKTGTQGIEFDFVTEDSQRARFSIYLTKTDGTQLFGYRQLMAMMTVLSLRQLNDPILMATKIYNYDTKHEETQQLYQFIELLNKPIGLLFEMEEYESAYGDTNKRRPVLAGIFQAHTELTASEILDRKTQPLKLPEMVTRLKDRPIKYSGASATNNASVPPSTYQTKPANLADMIDDVPF